MERKVVVTGINMITALGLDVDVSWRNMVAGKSGVRRISLFDASQHTTRIAAEVVDFEPYAQARCKKHAAKQMARATRFAYVCAKEAVTRSGIDFSQYDPRRCAVILGVVDTGHSQIHDDKQWILRTMPNGMSAWISLEYGLRGPNYTISTACASSVYATASGYDLIRSNRADVVIVGGASAIINPEHVNGFNELYALSVANDPPERASRPFSVDRDGFVVGEGAGIIILEGEDVARKRGATVHAELVGYGLTSEAYNIISPAKDGVGMAETMQVALDHAGINIPEVGYINAHGTGTTHNDRYETMAIKRVFGEKSPRVPVSSTKSMIGHTVAACGAIESIVAIKTINEGVITPTINYTRDPELDLDYVPNEARQKRVDVALSNSFAFGGHNGTLVFRKYN